MRDICLFHTSVNLEINEKAKLLNEIETYKHKVAALETQLAAQHSAEVHYHIDTYNDNSRHIHLTE